MNITAFNMYLLTRLDTMRTFCFVAAAITALVAIIVLIHIYVIDDECRDAEEKGGAAMPWMKRCAILFTCCALALTFIPSTNQMLLILGVPAVLQSRSVQKDLPEMYDKVIKKLLEQLDKPKGDGK